MDVLQTEWGSKNNQKGGTPDPKLRPKTTEHTKKGGGGVERGDEKRQNFVDISAPSGEKDGNRAGWEHKEQKKKNLIREGSASLFVFIEK